MSDDDRVLRLAVEMLGEGASIEVMTAEGVTTARAVCGKLSRHASVFSAGTAEADARAQLFRALLREHGDLLRERDWRASLDDAHDRAHGRHAHVGGCAAAPEEERKAPRRVNELEPEAPEHFHDPRLSRQVSSDRNEPPEEEAER